VSEIATSRYLPNDFYTELKARAHDVEARFRTQTPVSADMHQRALGAIPGGFTRDAVIRNPYAPYIIDAHGSEVVDLDGRHYVDFCYNATSLVLGHADPRVTDAIDRQARAGTAYYAPNTREVELAELIGERLPSVEKVRFTNSGSEAVMMAIRIARGHTRRHILVKFEGSYHGTYDDVQWSVNPPVGKVDGTGLPSAVPDTAGLPEGSGRTLVLPYNEPEAFTEAMSRHGRSVAAVIVEPMANRMGLILPDPKFLQSVIETCNASGAVAIFDEVIAFRLGYNGCQGLAGLTPHLTTLGKCIGGGLPVGAVAGRSDILACTEPGVKGRVTHAGTFNGNPLTMAAGLATMQALSTDAFNQINACGERMRARLSEVCEGLPLTVTGAGSLFKINAIDHPITSYRDSASVDSAWQQVASLALTTEGFLVSKGLQGCVSTATSETEIDDLAAAFEEIVRG
jgi:glutamate-1-semialdehyde 2,1-aminomutase